MRQDEINDGVLVGAQVHANAPCSASGWAGGALLYSPSHGAKAGVCVTSVAFDTLKFANRLKTAGVPAAHAEAEAEALAEVLETNLQDLATKRDLRELELKLESKIDKGFADVHKGFVDVHKGFAEIKGEMLLLKWMFGVIVTSLVALIIKAFF